ncbi:type II secretion system protein [Thiomicrorhabdus sp. zzn3]|uniref:type II secretion system protein n=1 Tax=Thiomicrorhabdus sp. zzn3 TaxID=3039775 RepID=UPI0024365341|nr:type II secretion system protein [Thiomicrorhabdus sp. zzn3]MDG6779112.1 type II secretion system protein [Thiomicrorhabdus sp. zzn3]
MPIRKNQNGFVLLLVIIVVAIIAFLWLSTQQGSLLSAFKNEQLDQDMSELEEVKRHLLEFAVLQPEVFLTDTTGVMQSNEQVPSPGYFPCPDLDGNGETTGGESSCGNPFNPAAWVDGVTATGFVPSPAVGVGYVPGYISTRNIYFGPSGRYFYFLDERFSTQNPNYVNGTLLRYAPLNHDQFVGDPATATNSLDPFDPLLTLNGVSGYIALIIDAGADGLDAENANGDNIFVSGTNDLSESEYADKIIGISFEEWVSLVARRVCAETGRYSGADVSGDYTDIVTTKHWFNQYDGDSLSADYNPGGGDWRNWGRCP